ncbi:Crp/Fnr family transcriptional regulator [Ramlibacter terrae]|uniref:Crp/Fnr family transcriptional regulator n=1 Tax=Ramlibacter terrae TaxID=2732511 RepID=A0ABX6P2T4_9BURK|nr:Crp/Fnr family transcriptional regulator [Ramlibacter terrae]
MPPQTVFVNEGEAADSAFVILSGRVKVFASDPEGREIVLNICGAGDCIGDMALDGGPRSASVITLDRVTCAVVPRDALHKAVATNPEFAMRLITTLIRRNRIATSKIKGLALQGVRERVLELLEDWPWSATAPGWWASACRSRRSRTAWAPRATWCGACSGNSKTTAPSASTAARSRCCTRPRRADPSRFAEFSANGDLHPR